jgi:hypothetical protein
METKNFDRVGEPQGEVSKASQCHQVKISLKFDRILNCGLNFEAGLKHLVTVICLPEFDFLMNGLCHLTT